MAEKTYVMILLFMGSIALASNAHGSVWPYHGSLGLVAPATGTIVTTRPGGTSIVQPLAISSKSVRNTIVAGPISSATLVKGSVAGPVTITAGSSATAVVEIAPTFDQKLSQGSVVIVSPRDGSITVTEGLNGATSTAVVGPSTGPVVVAGPSGVPPAAIPAVIPVAKVIGISNANANIIDNTGGSVLVKGATSGPTVIEGAAAGPIISQEIIDSTILLNEPEVKIQTPQRAMLLAPGTSKIAIPKPGDIAVTGPHSVSTIVSGPSGIITTS